MYEEVHLLETKEKPATHRVFLTKLKSMLPTDCTPIIITDAGFRGSWFKLVASLGWDYVGRVRNRTFCKGEKDEEWHPIKDLYKGATSTSKMLGSYEIAQTKPVECTLVVFKEKPKGRKNLTASGNHSRRSKCSLEHAKGVTEPWLLATSLSADAKFCFAKRIVALYRLRMQIEESFRDFKTGLNFNQSHSKKPIRLNALLLFSVLAQFMLYILGMAMKLSNIHYQYQANMVKDHNILSYQYLGLRARQAHYKIA